MRWAGLFLFFLLFNGCAVRVTVEPLPKKKIQKTTHYHKQNKTKEKTKTSPVPTPLTSPYPPDPRIEDIIRTLDHDRR